GRLGTDVAAGGGQVARGEEIARDLDDLLSGLCVATHRILRPLVSQRPPRSTRPGRAAAGTPRSTTGTPLTKTCSTPSAPWSSRRWRCGRSYTIAVACVPTRAGSKHTTSAAYPGASRPRRASP